MEWFLALVLFAVALYQRDRIRALHNRLEALEGAVDHVLGLLRNGAGPANSPEIAIAPPGDAAPVAEEAVPPPPAAKSVSVPKAVKVAPPPLEESAGEDAQPLAKGPKFALDFEDVFGRKLPIWAGGVTLAIAGVLLVRYSIEAGLLTQAVRVALAFLFGIALLVGAEAAFRFPERVGDDRVCQALAGAGLATLYAGFYLAGSQYALIGQTFAFLGLAGVTAAAIFLSYRFGLPSAVLGLIGGFAAPALVGGEDANLPLLALYLALVTGGLTQTGNRQRRPWLGLGALVGGLGWGGVLLTAGDLSGLDVLALGLFFVLLGAVLPSMLAAERFEQPLRLASAAIASLQLAVLVDQGGYSALAWGLYLLLGAALAWFGWRRPAFRAASAMAAAVGVLLLGFWPSPEATGFAFVLAALALLFAGVPLAHLQRGEDQPVDRFAVAGVSAALGAMLVWSWGSLERDVLRLAEALGCLALAILPALAARILWRREEPFGLAANLAAATLLCALAGLCLLPSLATPFLLGGLACALVWLLRGRIAQEVPLQALAWIVAMVAAISIPASDEAGREGIALIEGAKRVDVIGLLRWLAGGAALTGLALVERARLQRGVAEALAAGLAFAALAQVLPPIALVWLAAFAVVTLRWRQPERDIAMLALAVCIATWAVLPLTQWLEGGGRALVGDPYLFADLPSLRDTLGFALPFAIALAASRLAPYNFLSRPVPLFWGALPVAFVVLHVLFKQLLALETMTQFQQSGLAERTLFEALLLALAWGAARGFGRFAGDVRLASGIAALGLAHFAAFTLFWHNPLFAVQAVGPVPVANLALAAYGVAIAGLLSLRQWQPAIRAGLDGVVMVVAALGAITLLRQLFAGSILPDDPMTQAEDLLRSFVGIVLAVAFLLIGSRRGERSWRVGSLVLITGTAIKVFVFDTAGLEGLVRIASFVALGASLIGIGWFYSRQLRSEPTPQ